MSSLARFPHHVAALFAALALSPDAVFATDRHNRIVFWNQSAEHALGHVADDVLGSSCADLLQGCDAYGNRYCSDSCPVTQMASRSEVVRHFNLRLRRSDGGSAAFDVSILTFVLDSPDQFLLAHILKPSDRAPEPLPEKLPAAPRDQLVTVRSSSDVRARRLTEREVEVLAMLAAGHATPELAARLHISVLTARNHIQNILAKLEVHSKAEAVAFAFQKRLL
jgi:PAS domain S-box-containing protein